jgi:spore maturation protein CgeB
VIWLGANCLDHADKPVAAAAAWVARSLQEKRATSADHLVVLGFGSGYHLENLLQDAGKKISCIEPDVSVLCSALGSRDLRDVLQNLAALVVGQDQVLSFITPTSELLIRPQSMAATPEYAQQVKGIFYGKRGLKALHPKMAVLGPMEGGTLPIGQYSYSALLRAGQRVRGIDMSGFNPGYQLLEGFVSSTPRKNILQATYFEMMSATILEALSEKPIDILICMAQAPISPRVLTELRKRGVITVLWFVEDYLRFTYWQQMAQHYDFVFTIQKGECLEKLKKAGAGEVHYLPTACDPNFHTPLTLTAEEKTRWGSPISFVGAGYHNRQQMFASFANEPFRIWGSEWPMCKPFDRLVQEEARRISPEEYIKIFNATEINLNLHSSTERDGVDPFGDFLNPRTFELASCEAFQLVDERQLLSEAFEVGKEIVTFRNLADLREKIDYYLRHPEERTAIARRARARVLRDHTYDQRLQQMLSIIYASKFEQLRAKEDASPWSLMLQRAKPYPELADRCHKAFERGEEPMLDGLISDIVTGNGKLTETEQKLLFLFHVRKQIIRMTREESGEKQ